VRKPKQGRQDKTALGKRARSKKSLQAARNAREPWLLVASTRLAHWPAKSLVKVYRQRMQIELSFRDMKSQHFGEGLECSASRGVGRYTVLVLIASLARIAHSVRQPSLLGVVFTVEMEEQIVWHARRAPIQVNSRISMPSGA
jgi:hypothetical protein